MNRILLCVAICLIASGCTAFQPVADMRFAARPRDGSSAKTPRNATEPPAAVRPDEVAELVPGSQVEINYHSSVIDSRHLGTVLQAGPEGVALMNCHYFSVYKGPNDGPTLLRNMPYFDRLRQTAEIGRQRRPVEWVSIRRISDLRVLAPPPPDYVAPELHIDTDDQPDFDQPGLEFDFNLPASGRVLAPLAEIERLSFNRISDEDRRNMGLPVAQKKRMPIGLDSADLPVAGPNLLIGQFELTEDEELAMKPALNDPEGVDNAMRILDKATKENRMRWVPSDNR